MKIAVASDHRGLTVKDRILRQLADLGQEGVDLGPNSAESVDYPDYAAKVANIQSFVESLPSGYNTKIGQEGSGLSQGQRQRLLIARAIYKDPQYIFFDEATNALDSSNEQVIMDNLKEFFADKTGCTAGDIHILADQIAIDAGNKIIRIEIEIFNLVV